MAGKCPNCLMNVDGAPNIRTCATEVRDGMQVRHQNASPSLETDWLSGVQRFDWLMPVGWYYKTMTRPAMWHAAEPYVRKIAGLGDAPGPDDIGAEYEHTYRQAEVAVIGGGPAGMAAAAEAGEQGKEVILIDDQPALGGHLRYNKKTRADVDQYTARVKKLAGVEVIYPAYCFGLYEGNLLGVLQKNPHPGARERLIHLRARHVVVATGAYEVPLLFENNDLVGVMLSTAAQRLIHLYGILPGKRVCRYRARSRGAGHRAGPPGCGRHGGGGRGARVRAGSVRAVARSRASGHASVISPAISSWSAGTAFPIRD